ncbi:MAG: monovalent cation/H+ antiporter complex subunit F [Candidatus Thermoplasmatota archaeon]
MTSLAIYSLVLIAVVALSSYRIMIASSAYDRLISLNVAAVIISVVFTAVSLDSGQGVFLDIAVVFIVLNFIATLGFVKYLERSEFT